METAKINEFLKKVKLNSINPFNLIGKYPFFMSIHKLKQIMREANSMPNLEKMKSSSTKKRQYGATADLARELRIQRRLILKMTAQMDKAANATIDLPRRIQSNHGETNNHGDTVRENYERQQRRQKIAQTLKRTSTKNKGKSKNKNNNNKTNKSQRRSEKNNKLPLAYRSLRKEAQLRTLRDQQDEVDRPRIRRQIISQSYLRRSSSSGKIRLASHSGIWQPENPKVNVAEASSIARGRLQGRTKNGTVPENYYTYDGTQEVDDVAGVQHALSQYAYLINNRVKKKVYGKASFMSIPGMAAPESNYLEGDGYEDGDGDRDRMSNQLSLQQQEYDRRNKKNPLIHPADAELTELRKRQKKRMPVLLFPDVQGWQAQVSIQPLINKNNWSQLREKVRKVHAAGGGGGDKGRGKADTQIVQDLLTTPGLGYGEKLYNAAAETADREDLLKTTTFPKGWGTG